MEKKELLSYLRKLDIERTNSKKPYWKKIGTVLLEDEDLKEKWNMMVDSLTFDEYNCEAYLDETVQLLSMIKMNIDPKVIAETIETISNGGIIIDSLLRSFSDEAKIDEIYSYIDTKK